MNWDYCPFFCHLQTWYHTPFLGGWWTIPSHPNLFFLLKWESWKKKERNSWITSSQTRSLSVQIISRRVWLRVSARNSAYFWNWDQKQIHSVCVWVFWIFWCDVVWCWKREKEIKFSLLFSSEKKGRQRCYVWNYEEVLGWRPSTSLMKRYWSVQNLHQQKISTKNIQSWREILLFTTISLFYPFLSSLLCIFSKKNQTEKNQKRNLWKSLWDEFFCFWIKWKNKKVLRNCRCCFLNGTQKIW